MRSHAVNYIFFPLAFLYFFLLSLQADMNKKEMQVLPIFKMPATLRCFHEIKVSKYLRVKCILQNTAISHCFYTQLQALLGTCRQGRTLPGGEECRHLCFPKAACCSVSLQSTGKQKPLSKINSLFPWGKLWNIHLRNHLCKLNLDRSPAVYL